MRRKRKKEGEEKEEEERGVRVAQGRSAELVGRQSKQWRLHLGGAHCHPVAPPHTHLSGASGYTLVALWWHISDKSEIPL